MYLFFSNIVAKNVLGNYLLKNCVLKYIIISEDLDKTKLL
jgi:hypothetical protein